MRVPDWAVISRPVPSPPHRRRAVIIGAGPTGMSAAYHLGEHSLLLEQRASHTLGVGDGLFCARRKAHLITYSSAAEDAHGRKQLYARWQTPDSNPHVERAVAQETPSVRSFVLRGELRFGARVLRISPSARLIELADGDRIVFDKLISTLLLSVLSRLVSHELPGHVRHDESLRYWLSDHDVEVADRATQDFYGDRSEFAAGKRVAEQIGDALTAKFHNAGNSRSRGARLFVPRLVEKESTLTRT